MAQLAEWGRRVDVPVVTGPEKSDPASVVFDGMERAIAENIDVLMIDTAGRLQNKDNLMAELEKIGRIIKRVVPDAPHETLLALDASTGQNPINFTGMSNSSRIARTTPPRAVPSILVNTIPVTGVIFENSLACTMAF